MWKIEQIAYLAGIIDGEGSFYIGQESRRKKHYNSRLYVVNTDERLINWLRQTFGGLIYSRISKTHPTWKRKFEWITNKSEIIPITKAILPYLICKKQQAELMIKFRETFEFRTYAGRGIPADIVSLRMDMCNKMHELNFRFSNSQCFPQVSMPSLLEKV